MEHWRAQMLRRKTRYSGRSGQGDACEEHAQGNGETLVRVMRHQARTRRGGGIPPTKHRDANGGCSAREESSFSPKGATSMRRLGPAPEGAMRGFVSGRSRAEPSRVRRLRQDSPPTAYMYTPSGAKDAGIGRSRKASTVARNKAARCQANQHSTEGYRALSRNSPRRERAAATNRTARRNTTKRDPPLRKQGPRCSSGNCRAPSSGCRRSTHRRRRPCACPSISTPSSPFQSRAGQRP